MLGQYGWFLLYYKQCIYASHLQKPIFASIVVDTDRSDGYPALKESPTTKLSTWTLVYFCFPLCICILYIPVFCHLDFVFYDIFGNCTLYWKVGIFLKKDPLQQSCQLGGAIVVSTTNPEPNLSQWKSLGDIWFMNLKVPVFAFSCCCKYLYWKNAT